jgi:hypothetical protein
MFWLNGLAGTRKSTMMHTVASKSVLGPTSFSQEMVEMLAMLVSSLRVLLYSLRTMYYKSKDLFLIL